MTDDLASVSISVPVATDDSDESILAFTQMLQEVQEDYPDIKILGTSTPGRSVVTIAGDFRHYPQIMRAVFSLMAGYHHAVMAENEDAR